MLNLMNKTIVSTAVLAALSFGQKALAVAECTGYHSQKGFVSIFIDTRGAMGTPESGEVSFEKDGNKFGYRFGKEDISQFFENDDLSTGQAIVGALVYVNRESPVSVRYVGPNFTDMDLKAVLSDKTTLKNPENVMRVWKGPGHISTEQFQITSVVCSVF